MMLQENLVEQYLAHIKHSVSFSSIIFIVYIMYFCSLFTFPVFSHATYLSLAMPQWH